MVLLKRGPFFRRPSELASLSSKGHVSPFQNNHAWEALFFRSDQKSQHPDQQLLPEEETYYFAMCPLWALLEQISTFAISVFRRLVKKQQGYLLLCVFIIEPNHLNYTSVRGFFRFSQLLQIPRSNFSPCRASPSASSTASGRSLCTRQCPCRSCSGAPLWRPSSSGGSWSTTTIRWSASTGPPRKNETKHKCTTQVFVSLSCCCMGRRLAPSWHSHGLGTPLASLPQNPRSPDQGPSLHEQVRTFKTIYLF